MMLNDSMYGILFRDINPIRTFVDQRSRRQIHARAGIIINTGEDNYLTTADAVEAAHTVTVSQLLNEYFAHEAGLADWQLGIGHAFEINPDLPESFRLELAHALLARELFPDAPLKWMPPTKHMTGDVFRGNLLDGFFNLVGTMTGQGILLVGMMTEAWSHRGCPTGTSRCRTCATCSTRAAGCTRTSSGSGRLHPAARPTACCTRRSTCSRRSSTTPLERDRGRHLRDHEAPSDRRQGPGRRRPPRGGLLQPRHGDPGGRRMTAAEKTIIRPYGDTTGDGMVQVSFTLPVPCDKRAEGAALQLAAKMGLDPAMVVHAQQMGEEFTFFVVYGGPPPGRPQQGGGGRAGLRAAARQGHQHADQAAAAAQAHRGRRVHRHRRHTVGIDAILNLKGIAGEKGLEYYREFKVLNLGAQVSVPELVERARAERADAVLVSQVVTQRDAHLHNTKEMSPRSGRRSRPAAAAAGRRRPPIRRTRHDRAGRDRIFGRGTTPREVASYLVHQLITSRETKAA
jgi:methanogenic corrinoid protein MtbC1